jgi:hypothetical protein
MVRSTSILVLIASNLLIAYAQDTEKPPSVSGEWRLESTVTPIGGGPGDSTWANVVLEMSETQKGRLSCRLRWPNGDRIKCDAPSRVGNKITFRIARKIIDALDRGREYTIASTFEGTIGNDGRLMDGTRTSHPCSNTYAWSANRQ